MKTFSLVVMMAAFVGMLAACNGKSTETTVENDSTSVDSVKVDSLRSDSAKADSICVL